MCDNLFARLSMERGGAEVFRAALVPGEFCLSEFPLSMRAGLVLLRDASIRPDDERVTLRIGLADTMHTTALSTDYATFRAAVREMADDDGPMGLAKLVGASWRANS